MVSLKAPDCTEKDLPRHAEYKHHFSLASIIAWHYQYLPSFVFLATWKVRNVTSGGHTQDCVGVYQEFIYDIASNVNFQLTMLQVIPLATCRCSDYLSLPYLKERRFLAHHHILNAWKSFGLCFCDIFTVVTAFVWQH